MSDEAAKAAMSDGEIYSLASFGGDREAKRQFIENLRTTRRECIVSDEAARMIGNLRNWQREMERSSDQLRAQPGGNVAGTEMNEAANGSGAVAEALEDAAALIERQAARIAELEIAAEVMKGNWQEGAVSL